MPTLKRHLTAELLLLCLAVGGTQQLCAQNPTTWWPDPNTGLMWTGQVIGLGWQVALTTGKYGPGLNWQNANHYCSALNLGNYSGWRLPTLEEVNAILYDQQVIAPDGSVVEQQEFKGFIAGPILTGLVWTSTLSGTQEARTVLHGVLIGYTADRTNLLTNEPGVICVRLMEADLLQLAKDAQVARPVPDILTLKAHVPLTQARLAYQTGNYQESLVQSKNALQIKSDFVQAYWGLGISYGRLGQWDLSITNLQTALSLDKSFEDAKAALKWAKDTQKAAKTGKHVKEPVPQWNWSATPASCSARWINGNLACGS
jgi:tetratricopeptide (TPR) repeat protein